MLPVIIANHNRRELLEQTLDSLRDNSVGSIYTIVVDDCSTEEGMREFLESRKDISKVIFMKKQCGPGVCRNFGVASIPVEYKYLYFSDNDVYFEKGWNKKMLYHYMATEDTVPKPIGILGGARHPHHGVEDFIQFDGGVKIDLSDQQVGFSLFMSKKVWCDIGPFIATELGEYGKEDTELCNNARAVGYLIGSMNPPVVVHCGIHHSEGSKTAGAEHLEEMQAQRPEIKFL